MTTAERPITSATERSGRLKFRWPGGVRLLVAVIVAGLAALALVFILPRQLNVTTDIVGYPTFADFDMEWFIDVYYIAVIFFPCCALLIYVAQPWLGSRLGLNKPIGRKPDLRQTAMETELPAADQHLRVVAVVRTLAVGVSFGIEIAILAGATAGYFWVTVGAAMVVFTGLVSAAALLIRRVTGAREPLMTLMARNNALFAPLAVLGLLGVSASTTVTVMSDGSVHHYPWLPWWVAVPLTAALAGWSWRRLSAAHTDEEVRALERRTLLFVSAPLSLFLLLSEFRGALGPIDVFHEGEGLVAAKLTGAGYFYWRDLLSTHGFLQDVLMPWLGLRLLEDSRWGLHTAYPLLLTPLTFVSLYLLGAWLFEKSWAFVVALIVLMLSLQFIVVDTRFIFWPPILLLLGWALQSRMPWVAGLFGACVAAQAILVPESAYCVPACGVIVILHDLYHRQRDGKIVTTFSKTLSMIGGGVALFGVFILFLLSQHAVGDFFFYYLIFVPGHELTGGLPVHLGAYGRLALFFELAPPVAILLGFLYYTSRIIRKQPLDARDWVIGAVALFALPYYTKFLERADGGHAAQAYGASIPLILFLIYRGLTTVQHALMSKTWWRRFGGGAGMQPVAVLLLVGALASVMTTNAFHTSRPLADLLASTPDRFRTVAATAPDLTRLGYADNAIDAATVTDLQRIFGVYLRPGDWVFDFSNQPALIYYLLDQAPHVRYYNVSMAITERAQKDLIGELKRDPPRLVVFSNDKYGLLNWDGIPNMVRNYDVSQYILDNYTPLLSTHTQIIYGLTAPQLSPADAQRLPLQQPVVTGDLAFEGSSCDWGYAPNFLSISPPAAPHEKPAVTLSTAVDPNGIITFEGWAGDLATGMPARQVVVALGGKAVASSAPSLDNLPKEAALLGRPGFEASGYRLTARVAEQLLSNPSGLGSMRIFGVSAFGVASELPGSPGAARPALTQLTLDDGTVIPVRAGEVTGDVNSIIPSRQLVVSLPTGSTWSDYRWLEINTSTRFGRDRLAVYDDQSGEPGHQIIFRTLGGASTAIRVYVGSCAQWHGYGANSLFLGRSGGEDISAVRLLP